MVCSRVIGGRMLIALSRRTLLSEAERTRIIEIANEPRFAETPPARIVPALADEGIYIASESCTHDDAGQDLS